VVVAHAVCDRWVFKRTRRAPLALLIGWECSRAPLGEGFERYTNRLQPSPLEYSLNMPLQVEGTNAMYTLEGSWEVHASNFEPLAGDSSGLEIEQKQIARSRGESRQDFMISRACRAA
jgi:hypothetical protein